MDKFLSAPGGFFSAASPQSLFHEPNDAKAESFDLGGDASAEDIVTLDF